MSGSLEGAGGIGGLLERADGYNSTNGIWTNHNYYHGDGNGNITCLESNVTQTVAASYRYDAFGNTLASSGTLANSNTYRFSSKEFIPTAGLYYYLYRFYDPVLQRWLNRDPIEENGFNTLVARKKLNLNLPFVAAAYAIQNPASSKRLSTVNPVVNVYAFSANEPVGEIDSLGLNIGLGAGYGCIPFYTPPGPPQQIPGWLCRALCWAAGGGGAFLTGTFGGAVLFGGLASVCSDLCPP